MKKLIFIFTFVIGLVVFSKNVQAEMIEFPEGELAKESVVPVFDQPEAVKKRLVPFDSRFELGVMGGATLNDPFINAYPIGGEARYHFSDVNSLGVMAAYAMTSQSGYVGQIQGKPGGAAIPFSQAPATKTIFLGEYGFTPYYGKISLAKQGVMNLTISGEVGVGVINFTNDNSVLFSLGLNQRFFFTRNFGLKMDLRALFYQEVDVVPITPVKKNQTNLMLTGGFVYFIPQL